MVLVPLPLRRRAFFKTDCQGKSQHKASARLLFLIGRGPICSDFDKQFYCRRKAIEQPPAIHDSDVTISVSLRRQPLGEGASKWQVSRFVIWLDLRTAASPIRAGRLALPRRMI